MSQRSPGDSWRGQEKLAADEISVSSDSSCNGCMLVVGKWKTRRRLGFEQRGSAQFPRERASCVPRIRKNVFGASCSPVYNFDTLPCSICACHELKEADARNRGRKMGRRTWTTLRKPPTRSRFKSSKSSRPTDSRTARRASIGQCCATCGQRQAGLERTEPWVCAGVGQAALLNERLNTAKRSSGLRRRRQHQPQE